MKILYTFLLASLLTVSGWGQTTIMLEDFEDGTVNYTSSIAEVSDGSGDYWIRTDGSDINASFTNIQGSSFFGAQDTDADPGVNMATLTFSGINISGFSNLNFSGFFAEDDDGSNQDWDGNSQVKVEYSIDGGSLTEIFRIEAEGGTNTVPRVDTDFDGTGDGTEITDAFQAFSAAISGTGAALELVITVTALNDGDEDIAFDNIEITGTGGPSNTVVQFASSTYSLAEDGVFVEVCASITNPDATNATTVEVALDNASTATNGTDYDDGAGTPMAIVFPLTITFPANSSTDECFDIFISNDDMDVEGDEEIILNLQNAMGGNAAAIGSPATTTVTIIDNDMAPILAFFNEVHYDNTGGDVGEFIEVAVSDDFAGNLSDLVVHLYNGNGGATYDSHALSTFTAGVNAGGYTFYSKLISGIQNGNPDGFALVDNGTVVEFLSYGGSFTATNGPASGATSTDIGVSETGSTPIGQSLQRVGSCTTDCPTGLSWTGPMAETPGDINTGQLLPVTLASFMGKAADKAVELRFSTTTEAGNSHFLIERSNDGRMFTTIGRVEGAGTTDEQQHYRFFDSAPQVGTNYYRLQQFDFDGTSATYGPVAVRFAGDGEVDIQLWPLPANEILNVQLPSEAQDWTLEVVSLNGQLMLQELVQEKTINATLDIQRLPAGSYLLRLIGGGQLISKRFIKQ